MGNERSQILGQRDRTVARRAEEISTLSRSTRGRGQHSQHHHGKHEDENGTMATPSTTFCTVLEEVRCERTTPRHLLDGVPESLVPRARRPTRSSSAGPVTSDRRDFRCDEQPELARLEMSRRSASVDTIFSVTPLQFPHLSPPRMPELLQCPQLSPMLVQRPAPASLSFSLGMAPGASAPAAGGSLLVSGPAIPAHAGCVIDRTTSCQPQSAPDSGFGAVQYSVDFAMPARFEPSEGSLNPLLLRQEATSQTSVSHSSACVNTGGSLKPMPLRQEVPSYACRPHRMRDGYAARLDAHIPRQSKALPTPDLPENPAKIVRQTWRPQSDSRIANGRLSLGSRLRGPRRGSEQGIPVNTESFGIVCGSPSVSASSRAASPGAVSEARSVSRRMNELAAMCRTRLAKSRRKADDAEAELHVVEKDLSRIELELEAARYLFDSGEMEPERRMSDDLVCEPHSPAGTVPIAVAPEKATDSSLESQRHSPAGTVPKAAAPEPKSAAPDKAPRKGSLESANNSLLDVLKSLQSPRHSAGNIEQLPPCAHLQRDADSACHEEARHFSVGDPVQGRFRGDWYSAEIRDGPDPEGWYKVYFFTDKRFAKLRATDLKACPSVDDLDQLIEGSSEESLSAAPPFDARKAARMSDAQTRKLGDLKRRLPIAMESKASAKKLLSLVQAFREELTICKANTS